MFFSKQIFASNIILLCQEPIRWSLHLAYKPLESFEIHPQNRPFWTFCLINKMSKNDYFGLFWNSLFPRILGLFPIRYFCMDWQSNIVLELINTIWLVLFSAPMVLSFAAILGPRILLRIVHSRSFSVAGLRRKAYLHTSSLRLEIINS